MIDEPDEIPIHKHRRLIATKCLVKLQPHTAAGRKNTCRAPEVTKPHYEMSFQQN